MASTERLPSGRWRGLYVDAEGHKRTVPGTFERKTDARDAAVESQAKAKRAAAATTGTLAANTLWVEWWELLNRDRVHTSDRGIKQAYVVEKHLEPKWASTPLNRFKKREIQAWLDGLCRQGYSPGYVRNIYAPLQWSINRALDEDVLEASPIAGIKLPRAQKRSKKFVEVGEPDTLGKKMNARYVDAADFILEVGCRPGELAGLHAEQLDLKHGWADIDRAYVSRLKKVRPLPKDGDDRRVFLSTKATDIIRRQLAGRDLNQGCGIEHTDGATCTSPLVFLNLAGRVLTPDRLSLHLRESARALGMKAKSAYGLRRGFATRAIEGGADVFAVQRAMGHADLDELAGYVQETTAARAKLLAALGDRPTLAPVEDVGRRGTKRGTDSDDLALPGATTDHTTDTG